MNKIHYKNKIEMQGILESLKRTPNVFVAELFGIALPSEKEFMTGTLDAFCLPSICARYLDYSWYNDYICDLLWIEKPDIAMVVHDFNYILQDDPKIKQWWIEDLERIVLPWWDGEVVGHMVGGYPREFNVYLETESGQKDENTIQRMELFRGTGSVSLSHTE